MVWENTNDDALLAEAHAEILKSTGGNPPPILDPFAGGGSIPLEAQRLGLEAHASDPNPVAVLINKALIEIPPKWAGHPPAGATDARMGDWPRATGLAEDVRRCGQWMRDEVEKRIGHLYPKATLPDGTKANVIAWIWQPRLAARVEFGVCCGPGQAPTSHQLHVNRRFGNCAELIPRGRWVRSPRDTRGHRCAEGQGFEPWVTLPPQRFSRPSP